MFRREGIGNWVPVPVAMTVKQIHLDLQSKLMVG